MTVQELIRQLESKDANAEVRVYNTFDCDLGTWGVTSVGNGYTHGDSSFDDESKDVVFIMHDRSPENGQLTI